MLNTHDEVVHWLDKVGIKNYFIRDDLTVDVDGDVNIIDVNLVSFPVQFGVVSGDFECDGNELVSLVGCPVSVGGDFDCYCNELVSLAGAPLSVGGDFRCYGNKLVSLAGGPKYVGGDFRCDDYLKSCVEYKLWFVNRRLKGI